MSESIYSWIKETPPAPEKPAMYHSKHDPTASVYKASSTFTDVTKRKPFGSMGRELKGTIKPDAFMHAHEKTGRLGVSAAPKFERTHMGERKPPVPTRADAPLHGLSTGKNFVVTNAVDAILAVPKRKAAPTPDWLAKPDFGRVPEYLEHVKKDVEAEHEYIQTLLDQQQMEEEAATGSSMRELGMAEREELLDALKSKWDEANAAYQRITFKKISTSNSTIGEIRWKEQCERTLAQLEKEIERLSVKGPIYVVDDGAAPSATAGAGRRH